MLADNALDDIARTAEEDGWTIIRVKFDDAVHRGRIVRAFDDRFGMRAHWLPDANVDYPRVAEVAVLSAKMFALGALSESRDIFIETMRNAALQQPNVEHVPVAFMRSVIAQTEAKLAATTTTTPNAAAAAVKRKEGGDETAENSKTLKRRKASRAKHRVK